MKTTKKIALIGILAALYFVLSLTLKIPFTGHITLDLGYLVLTVAAVTLGAIPAALVGAIGAAVESMLLSPLGLSIGWVAMNFCVGLIAGLVLHNYPFEKHFLVIMLACIVVIMSVLVGIVVKTAIECLLYSIPLAVKLPKSTTAFIVDTIVMLAGLPLAAIIQRRNVVKGG